ncbi:MAG: DUF5009 domain-containing protein [Saprospiraceae bacterium]
MRYLSIDFFRGGIIALMILVNTPGTWEFVYPPLRHAEWHGFTPTDLVFPSFMFIIGLSMWFSFAKYERKWSLELGRKILRRTVILFVIGLILNNFPMVWKNWDHWRIMGVLQRLALGYGLASVIVLTMTRRVSLMLAAVFLLGYWALLYYFGVPGEDPYALQTNAVLRLDRFLFTDAHLWYGEGLPFDPEGVLSTIPSIVTVLFGWYCGNLVEYRKGKEDLLARDLLAIGVAAVALGMFWDLFFPINKKLWTSSFVLFAGGLSTILFAFSIWLIEVRKWKSGVQWFLIFGSNALFAYVFSEALVLTMQAIKWDNGTWNLQSYIYQHVFVPIEGKMFSSMLFALSYVAICWLMNRWLYAKKIFIKI